MREAWEGGDGKAPIGDKRLIILDNVSFRFIARRNTGDIFVSKCAGNVH